MKLSVLKSCYCFETFPEGNRWVIIEPTGETSSHIWDQANCLWFLKDVGHLTPGSMMLTGSTAWPVFSVDHAAGTALHRFYSSAHTKQMWLLTKDSGFAAHEKSRQRSIKLCGYIISRRGSLIPTGILSEAGMVPDLALFLRNTSYEKLLRK